MPLAGTKREQKHYRRIREEYPEKGKEYAARVARNIVRTNTPGGRKLKGNANALTLKADAGYLLLYNPDGAVTGVTVTVVASPATLQGWAFA